MFHSFLRYNIIGTLIFITRTTVYPLKTIIPTAISQLMELNNGDTLSWDVEFMNGEKVIVVRKQ